MIPIETELTPSVCPSENPGISMVCAVKNRFEPLQFTIPTYLRHPHIAQIVLVDWSSDVPLVKTLDCLDVPFWPDDRVEIVRAVDQPYWNSARAFNLGMMFVDQHLTLKIDGDVALVDHVLGKPPTPGMSFITGDKDSATNANASSLYGTVFFPTDDYRKIGGYDERYNAYGFEDDDFFERLRQAGLKHHHFDSNVLFHLPHSNRKRTAHHEIQHATVGESIDYSFKKFLKRKNWSIESKRTRYRIVRQDSKSNYRIVKAIR